MTDRLHLLLLPLLLLVVTDQAASSSCSDESTTSLLCARLVRSSSYSVSENQRPYIDLQDGSEVPSRSSKRMNYVEDKKPSTVTRTPQDGSKKAPSSSRQHKAFFVNYPALQRVYQDKPSAKKKLQKKKQKPESDIYFIKLPPSPYSFVPGLGYVSQPPQFSAQSLLQQAVQPPPKKKKKEPFINLPIDFVSNGKPTSVYRTKDSPIVRLNRGPYVFDGRPSGSVYLLKKTRKKQKKTRVLFR